MNPNATNNAMKTLADIQHLEGVKVLLRVDFNVPMKNGAITDDFRIRKALPTIDFLRNKGARLILVSHIETSDGLIDVGRFGLGAGNKKMAAGDLKLGASARNPLAKKPTLAPVADYLKKKGLPVTFVKSLTAAFSSAEALKDGEIILLENIRENPGEKENDRKFAEQLASLADIYVNDAFSVSHREHASVCAVTEFLPSYAGLQLEEEVKQLSAAFSPSHPFIFILGGAKFDTKLPLIQRFSKTADAVFIGGALANDALKAKGFGVGVSKISDGTSDISNVVNQPNIMIPVDVVVQDHSIRMVGGVGGKSKFDVGDMIGVGDSVSTNTNSSVGAGDFLGAGDSIFDAGPKTIVALKEKIGSAQFILWNGPLGVFEKGFTEGTEALAKIIADRTENGKKQIVKSKNKKIEGENTGAVRSIVGGGDTLAAISKLGVENKFTFVSTGGGAMLDFLATGTLPGIEALEKSKE
jgi:phosphoglycerate kinase